MYVPTITVIVPTFVQSILQAPSRQSTRKLHSAPPSNPLHVRSSTGLSTFPLLGFPAAVPAGATTVLPAEPVADDPALVVEIAEGEADADDEVVTRGRMVLLVVYFERGMGEGILEVLL